MSAAPHGATAALVLADGTVIWGRGLGAAETRVGEVCFNTSMTGYQEILTDPSYAGQLITFTFPIGNVGTNGADIKLSTSTLGLISRAEVAASNHRAESDLHTWLTSPNAGIDRRRHPPADPPHSQWRSADRRASACAGRLSILTI